MLMMLNPHAAILIMFTASVFIGYYTMPIILGYTSPYTRYSSNKMLSALLMGILMALIEVLMHSGMLSVQVLIAYIIVLVVSALLVIALLQNQTLVDDRDFLRGMIEHHAMGVKMSEKFTSLPLNDISRLANNIVSSQTVEIHQMEKMLE